MVYVKIQGVEPVNATESSVDPPLHIVVPPDITAVGRGLTVTVVLLLISDDCATHELASDNAVNEYVVVEDGDTLKM